MRSPYTLLLLVFALAGCSSDGSASGANVGSISCDPDPVMGDDCLGYCDANDCSAEENFTESSRCQGVGNGEGMCVCSCGNFNAGGTGGTTGAGGGGGSTGFGGFGGGPMISRECDPADLFSEANCFLYCDSVPCSGGQSFVLDSMCAAQPGGGHECECECGGS